MENAVDALKIAFAVMIFTMALTLAIAIFSQARETSEAVLYMNDKTNYYEYEGIESEESKVVNGIAYTEYTASGSGITYTDKRIVGIDAIIPTLYRYYKENYTVIFDNMESDFYIYQTKEDISGNDKWTNLSGDKVNYFDLNSEITANCPWVGTVNDIKKNLDLFLDGTVKYEYGSGLKGFIKEYANATFLEQLGEYSTDRTYGIETDNEGKKWLVIGNEKWEYDSDTGKVKVGAGEQKLSDFLKSKDLDINNNATTYYHEDETDGEIIELAKPTIKRVVKYTLIENNP